MKKQFTWILAVLLICLTLVGMASCAKVQYRLNFVVDGENYAEIDTAGNETISLPDDPRKEGYVFDGWYWDDGTFARPFTAESLLSEKLTGNMSVYAKFVKEDITKKHYDVTFNTMGGSITLPQLVLWGTTVAVPEKPTRTGYALVGWYREADCTTKWDFARDTVRENITLYAKWVPEQDAAGCDILEAREMTMDGLVLSRKVSNATEHLALSEYLTVSPWANWRVTRNIDGSDEITSGTVDLAVGDNTYYILVTSGNGSNKRQYTVNIRRRPIYDVTYVFDNGENSVVERVEEDSFATAKDASRTGYTFLAWQRDGVDFAFETTAIAEDTTLTAAWEANTYTVTPDAAGGSATDPQTLTYDALYTLPVPTRRGYTFLGWQLGDTLLTDDNGASLAPWTVAEDTTLTAAWQVNVYSVLYHLGGGTNAEDNPARYTVEDADITLAAPTRAGYTFLGFFAEEACTTPVTVIATADAENRELWAKWEAITYRATFTARGETVGTVDFTMDMSSITPPAIPEVTGYTAAWESFTLAPQNLTIEAVYTPIVYGITYEGTKGAANRNPSTYTIETPTITLADLTATGYTFDGWYDKDGNRVTEIALGSHENITLTARWTAIVYRITYTGLKDGTNRNETTYTIETPDFTLSEVTGTGYTFTGWYSGSKKVTVIAKGSYGDMTLNATWSPVVYGITYEGTKGAANRNPSTYTIETPTITLADLTATGYTFDGWYDKDGNHVTEITLGSHENITLTARWTAIVYHIYYMYNDAIGTYPEGKSNPLTYTIEDRIVFEALVNKTVGYTFNGWFTEKNNGTGTLVAGIPQGSIGDRTVYAQWGLEEYRVTYHDLMGADNTANLDDYTVETALVTLTELSRVGYVFDGFYTDRTYSTRVTTLAGGETGDRDLYAKWTPIVYHITYVTNGGTVSGGENPTTYTIEDAFTLLDLTREDYPFLGWYDGPTGGNRVTEIRRGTTGNLTIYAPIGTKILFESNGGTAVPPMIELPNVTVSAPAAPTKAYYTFAGWYTDAALTAPFAFEKMPTEDITLYAGWTPVAYTIRYVLDGGTNNAANPATYTVEDSVTWAAPDKVGYTFIGWFTSDTYTTATTGIDVGTHGTVTVYARFKINRYTISFDTNGGSTVAPVTQNYQTSVEAPPAPAKNGYAFAGWYADAALTKPYTFTTIPAQDITLYARWTLVTYRITYQLDGGENASGNPTSYTVESDTITFATPTKAGYRFDGWFSDSAYTTRVTGIEHGGYSEVELHAKWTPITYRVTYVLPTGATQENALTYTVETPAFELRAATHTGYTFGGWYRDAGLSDRVYTLAGGMLGDVTVYGKFTANIYTVHLDGTEEATYTVSFDLNGADGTVESQTVREGVTLSYPAVPTRAGYLFAGWYDNRACTGRLYDFTAQITRDITLYANWIRLRTGERPLTVGSTAEVTLNGTTDVIYVFVPAVSGNVTLTTTGSYDTFGALYNAAGVLLAQDDDSGSEGDNFLLVYNVTAGKPYYLHIRSFSSATTGKATLSLTGNTTVPAGGYVVTPTKTQATFGSAFTLTTPAARDGYKFLGYMTADGTLKTDASGRSLAAWDIAADTVLYSKWERMVYTVTFVTGSGSAIDSVTLAYGDRLDLNDYVTTRAGYSFRGWRLDGADYEATTMPDHDITLTAQWTRFALGSIKYDTDKKAVSINDFADGTLPASLFGALCLDTDGNVAIFTVQISGTVEAGQTVTVRLTAESNGKKAQVTIENVKIYGDPTLTYDTAVRDFNIGDLSASHFGASGQDTFGAATEIRLRVEGTYQAGDTVTVIIESVDPAGNVTTARVTNVRVYGTPTVTYLEDKEAIRATDEINAALFRATAKDSFGADVTVTVALTSGTQAAGNTVTLTFTATDGKGNVTTFTRRVKVYGTPTVLLPSKTDCRVTDTVTPELLGITGMDTYGGSLTVSLTVTSGTQTAGGTLVILASVTDAAGNTASREIRVRVYGTPTISYDRAAVRVGEDATDDDVTVTFDLNGATGTAPAAQTVTDRVGLTYPSIPTRTGYVFAGWYPTAACTGDPYDFTAPVPEDTTLYARWIPYSGGGVLGLNGSLSVSVVSKSNSVATSQYLAFVPLADGTVTLYSTGSLDTYGYLYDSAKNQLATDDDGGTDRNFKITYAVKAGTLYYLRPCGYNGSGTTTVAMSGAVLPGAGGKLFLTGAKVALRAAATDSFGRALTVTARLKSGSVTRGDRVVYTLTATDHLGNTVTLDTAALRVYDGADITFTYNPGDSDLIRLTSHGEEFSAAATDTFGEACTVTVEAVEGTLTAGREMQIRLVATDAAGNRKESEAITVKVYGIPTVTPKLAGDTIYTTTDLGEDPTFLFTVRDSFGIELYATVTVDGTQTLGGVMTYTVTAEDDAGNTVTATYAYRVICSGAQHTFSTTVHEHVGATCTAGGYDIYLCTLCGAEKHVATASEPALGHDWSLTATTATCTTAGMGTYECTRCHERKQKATKALGHDWSLTATTATCTSAGTESYKCTRCHETKQEATEAYGHGWSLTATTATCTTAGMGTYECTRCHETKQEMTAPLGHVGAHNENCTRCGALIRAYIRCDKDNKPNASGKYILFGEYPQTLKADDVTITGTTDSRGYYLGSDGYYYARITATPYESSYKFSTGTTVTYGTVYYFRVEPIRWRILTEGNGKAFLLCDSVIANRRYDDGSNNYANSEIRAWLNEEFYKTAFSALQQELILVTTVDNSARSTNPNSNATLWNDGKNSSACANTSDKIFLLSMQEVTNSAYGFSLDYSSWDTARRRQTSDYARATGAYMYTYSGYYGNGEWWLRSPYYTNGTDIARDVYHHGYAGSDLGVHNTYGGCVPALWISL